MVGALPYKTIQGFLSRSSISPNTGPQPPRLGAVSRVEATTRPGAISQVEHGVRRRGRCSLISAANPKRAFSKGVLPEIGRFSSTREEIAMRRRGRLITRMPPTWPFSYASFATASCEGGKTPSERLPLMKTARFLAGWGVFSAIRQEGLKDRDSSHEGRPSAPKPNRQAPGRGGVPRAQFRSAARAV